MTPTDKILLIAGVLLLAAIMWLLKGPGRHKRNVQKARRIQQKINSFEGEYRNAMIYSYLRKIDPFVFEELLLNAFEQHGYKIKRNKRYTGDGGIDGKVFDGNGRLMLIQAKRYAGHIKRQDVVDFAHLVNKKGAARGFFVHTGKTGKGVFEMVSDLPIVIVSGKKLLSLLEPAAASPPAGKKIVVSG